jgi:hypothetical protein
VNASIFAIIDCAFYGYERDYREDSWLFCLRPVRHEVAHHAVRACTVRDRDFITPSARTRKKIQAAMLMAIENGMSRGCTLLAATRTSASIAQSSRICG